MPPVTVSRLLQPIPRTASPWLNLKDSHGFISRAMSTTSRPYLSWLQQVIDKPLTPPKLFAWTPQDVSPHLEDKTSDTSRAVSEAHSQNDLDRRIFILGIGNMGRLYATYLAQMPNAPPITLVVHRKELLSAWKASRGIELTVPGNGVIRNKSVFDIEWWTEELPPSTSTPDHAHEGMSREIATGGKIGNIIIATKAQSVIPETDRLRRYLDSRSTIAMAQNGMSKLWPPLGDSYIAERFLPLGNSGPNFVALITTHGVTSQAPFSSTHASIADVAAGPVLLSRDNPDSVGYLLEKVTTAPGLEGRRVARADLWVLQLEKLIVNSIINPLTAVLRCKNGVLFSEAKGPVVRIMDRLLEEAGVVLQRLANHESSAEIIAPSPTGTNQRTPVSGSNDIEALRSHLTQRFSQTNLREMLWRVGHKVSENTSSMLQDMRAGKQTEIRDFNGWIVETAHMLDPSIDVSTHRSLVEMVESGVQLDAESLERVLTKK